ncbi:hypothetical protein D9M71_266530 [compost metagenome]
MVGQQLFEGAGQGGQGIGKSRQVAADADFLGAGGVVVTVPAIRNDQRRQTEVQRLAEAVVAAVMDERIAFLEHGRLGKPAVEVHVVRHGGVHVAVGADVDQEAVRQAFDRADQAFHHPCVGGAEAAEAEVDQRRVVVPWKVRDNVRRFAAYAAVEVDVALRIERLPAFIAHRRRRQQQVEPG